MDKKQQQQLDRLFKEVKSWNPDYYLGGYVGSILIGITMIIWVMPSQLCMEEGDVAVFIPVLGIELMGLSLYLLKFRTYNGNGAMKSVDEILQYLPVSRRQLYLYRVTKLAKICVWLTGISIFCQTFFALVFMHTFSVGNLLMPLICNFLVPMFFMGSLIFTGKA